MFKCMYFIATKFYCFLRKLTDFYFLFFWLENEIISDFPFINFFAFQKSVKSGELHFQNYVQSSHLFTYSFRFNVKGKVSVCIVVFLLLSIYFYASVENSILTYTAFCS